MKLLGSQADREFPEDTSCVSGNGAHPCAPPLWGLSRSACRVSWGSWSDAGATAKSTANQQRFLHDSLCRD